MKPIHFFFFFSIFFSCLAVNKKYPEKNQNIQIKELEIVQIDSINNVYISYWKNDNTFYKVLSLKQDSFKNCKKIVLGNKYRLKLKSYFDNKPLSTLHLDGIEYHGELITIEGDSITDIYISKSLRGLCIN